MRGSPFTIVAGFVVLFLVSIGAGYTVGARDRSDAVTTAEAASDGGDMPDGPVAASGPPAPPTTEEPTTTTTEPGPRRPTTDDPLRVVLAGDSVMAGLAPALKASVDDTTEVRFVLTPSILRDPTIRFSWNQQLEEFDPEVVIMFVGTWESEVLRTGAGPASNDPAWREQYEREILDPWLELITSRGASVIWIGNPTVGTADGTAAFTALNEAYADLPNRWPQVTYLATQEVLNGPGPEYHDVIALPDGSWLRTRQTDGLHLCADGAALLADVVVGELETGYKATTMPNWQTGSWRDDVLYPPASCPIPSS